MNPVVLLLFSVAALDSDADQTCNASKFIADDGLSLLQRGATLLTSNHGADGQNLTLRQLKTRLHSQSSVRPNAAASKLQSNNTVEAYASQPLKSYSGPQKRKNEKKQRKTERNDGGTMSKTPDHVLCTVMGVCFVLMGIIGLCLRDWASEDSSTALPTQIEQDQDDMKAAEEASTGVPDRIDAEESKSEETIKACSINALVKKTKDTQCPSQWQRLCAIVWCVGPVHHRIPWQRYFALGFWFLLLLANAAFTRLVCHYGIPQDCQLHDDRIKDLHSVQRLLFMGFILAVLAGIMEPVRFGYLFSMTRSGYFRGVFFILIFMGTSPAWGSLDLFPSLSKFSIATGGDDGERKDLFDVLRLALLIGGATLVLFHFAWAFVFNPIQGFLAYTISRVTIWLLYVAFFVESSKKDSGHTADFHLHHYMIGFLFAILAEFNNPISLLLLAIGSGVFVQGIAAYNADPLIYQLPGQSFLGIFEIRM